MTDVPASALRLRHPVFAALMATKVTQPTHRAAVLGSPISHSLSPILHTAGFEAVGLSGWEYSRILCEADDLPGVVGGADPSFRGFSVTMPCKFAALDFTDEVADRAREIGSANTLVRIDGSRWRADNTDAEGAVVALQELLKETVPREPTVVLFAAFVLMVTLINLFITSGSAQWALMAPVVVPMMMYVNVSPEVTQMLYRIGDSPSNIITPMSPYFALALTFLQKYYKKAGVGTLISLALPCTVSILIGWFLFFLIWYYASIPLGPGSPMGYEL